MGYKRAVAHIEGAFIEVQYAAADVRHYMPSEPAALRTAAEEMLYALLTVRGLLKDALAASQRVSPPVDRMDFAH
jgi:hypothetical protein